MKKLFVLFFIIGILMPAGKQAIFGASGVMEGENRVAASFPDMPKSMRDAQAWPDGVNAWINDHFGFRNLMIYAARRAELTLHLTPSAVGKAMTGQDGWMFYSGDFALEDYMGVHPYSSDADAMRTVRAIKATNVFLASSGAEVLFAIVPSKSAIYSEHMRTSVPHRPEYTRAATLKSLIGDDPDILFLDEAMRAAKTEGMVYFKTDTHWTDLGAYYGYRAIMEGLGLKPLALDHFDQVERDYTEGGLVRMLNLSDVPPERLPFLKAKRDLNTRVTNDERYRFQSFNGRVFETKLKNKPTLLLIGDSFSVRLIPFLEQHFSRIMFLHNQAGQFDPSVLDAYPSDYILVETVDRIFAADWAAPS